jgi:hypothetical protein
MPVILSIYSVSAANHLNDFISEKWAVAYGEHRYIVCMKVSSKTFRLRRMNGSSYCFLETMIQCTILSEVKCAPGQIVMFV